MTGPVLRVPLFSLGLWCSLAAVAAQGQTFTLLHKFTGGSDGAFPTASVIVDSSGNIYGTTRGGGTDFLGTVFRFDPQGNETVLHAFTGPPDGSAPEAELVADDEGNLYGTTTYGGVHNFGTVFKIDNCGHYSVLHSFKKTGDGQYPDAGLIRDHAGNLYGVANGGGTAGHGAVYMISNTGRESLLHSFQASPDGSNPLGDLLRDRSGNLYGTTYIGGDTNSGTVFKLSPKRQETVVFSFPGGTDGGAGDPHAGLIRDAKGNLYGTSLAYDHFKEEGTVFKIDRGGKETVLHQFTGGDDGADPRSRLVRDKDGNLYGTANAGGAFLCGTVFKLDTSGTLTVLHSFSGLDGCGPRAGLAIDDEGNLYGTTFQSVVPDGGTLFKISP